MISGLGSDLSSDLGAKFGLNPVSKLDQNLAQNPSQNRAQNPSQNRAQIRPALGLMRGQPGRQHKRDLRCAYANSARDRRPRNIPLLAMVREMRLGAQTGRSPQTSRIGWAEFRLTGWPENSRSLQIQLTIQLTKF